MEFTMTINQGFNMEKYTILSYALIALNLILLGVLAKLIKLSECQRMLLGYVLIGVSMITIITIIAVENGLDRTALLIYQSQF